MEFLPDNGARCPANQSDHRDDPRPEPHTGSQTKVALAGRGFEVVACQDRRADAGQVFLEGALTMGDR